MASAKNAKIQVEMSQTFVDYAAMTNSGDEQIFTISGGTLWSGREGYEPEVRPNGVVSGSNMLSTNSTNDTVVVAGCTAYLKGISTTVSATTTTITRCTTAGAAKITSITIASDGSVAAVAGIELAGGAFASTRAASGGPPLIPTTSVEIGQIRVTSSTSAALSATEIFQNGSYTERYDYPVWEENNIGDGNSADAAIQENAYIKFASALPAIHTGAIPKAVYIAYYTPELSDQYLTEAYTKAEESGSTSSSQIYGGQTISSSSKSLGAGGFSAYLRDGVSDFLTRNAGEVLINKFYPDENKSAYCITQGGHFVKHEFPAQGSIKATVSVNAERKTVNFNS